MENDYNKYGNKVQRIVKNKIKLERVKFRGKKITREIVEKEWKLPKIITTDIGFQLMFGFDGINNPKQTQSSLTERSISINHY